MRLPFLALLALIPLLASCKATMPDGIGFRFSVGYKGINVGIDVAPAPPAQPEAEPKLEIVPQPSSK